VSKLLGAVAQSLERFYHLRQDSALSIIEKDIHFCDNSFGKTFGK
jgi:hypothetical protein